MYSLGTTKQPIADVPGVSPLLQCQLGCTIALPAAYRYPVRSSFGITLPACCLVGRCPPTSVPSQGILLRTCEPHSSNTDTSSSWLAGLDARAAAVVMRTVSLTLHGWFYPHLGYHSRAPRPWSKPLSRRNACWSDGPQKLVMASWSVCSCNRPLLLPLFAPISQLSSMQCPLKGLLQQLFFSSNCRSPYTEPQTSR